MINARSKTRPIILLAFFGSMLVFGAAVLGAQTASGPADPFYLKLLSEGEEYFHAQDYQTAAKSLKVAVFGLVTDKTLQGKALGYLCLSHFNLKEDAEARACIIQVIGLVGLANISSLAMDDADREHLARIAAFYRLDQPAAGATTASRTDTLPSTVPAAPSQKKETAAETIKAFEKKIKDNPKSVQAYLDLHEFQKQQGDPKAARLALEDLIKNNPLEAKAYLTLGKLYYEDKEFNKSSETLKKMLSLPGSAPADDKLRGEAAFYLTLSDYLNKDKELAFETYSISGRLIQGYLDGGPALLDPDLIIWQNIRRAADSAPRVYLADVRIEKPAEGLEVKIILSGPAYYRTFILTKERSIIVELFHIAGSKAPGAIDVNARGVKAIKAGMFQKDTARVTLESLKQVPSHRIIKTDEGLSVIIE